MFLFTAHHINLIKSGVKTQTRRVGDRFRANVGSIQQCRLTLFGAAQCRIRILRRWEEQLSDISSDDALAEGVYSVAEYIEGFVKMHHGKITPNATVKCYEFELVGVRD